MAEWDWREYNTQFYVTHDKEFVITDLQQSFQL